MPVHQTQLTFWASPPEHLLLSTGAPGTTGKRIPDLRGVLGIPEFNNSLRENKISRRSGAVLCTHSDLELQNEIPGFPVSLGIAEPLLPERGMQLV